MAIAAASPLSRNFWTGIQKSVTTPHCTVRLRAGGCVLYAVHPSRPR